MLFIGMSINWSLEFLKAEIMSYLDLYLLACTLLLLVICFETNWKQSSSSSNYHKKSLGLTISNFKNMDNLSMSNKSDQQEFYVIQIASDLQKVINASKAVFDHCSSLNFIW